MVLQFDPEDNVNFWTHAKMTFNHCFHMISTELHSLALFLHPFCRKLAVTQVANGQTFDFMVKVALDVAKQWRWDRQCAMKLSNDLQAYNCSVSPFSGANKDGLTWWQNLPISSEDHPLKAFTIMMLSIVGHVGNVERLFSDLGMTQSPRHCNLKIETFEMLGKIRGNLRHHLHEKMAAAGKKVWKRQMPGIDLDVAGDLENNFAWVPPLALASKNVDDDLAGPESIMMEELDAEFDKLFESTRSEHSADVDGKEVLEGKAFDFNEFERVERGIAPAVAVEEISVINNNPDDNQWDPASMMQSVGLSTN